MHNRIEILRMPKLGMTMTEATVTAWYVDIGTQIDAGTEIAEVTTEKINLAITCHTSGVLRRILVDTDETASVAAPLAVIAEADMTETEINQALST